MSNYSTNARISVTIQHGDSSYSNEAQVSGNDRAWVASTMARIEEWVADLKRQYVPSRWLLIGAAVSVFVSFAGFAAVFGWRLLQIFDYPPGSTGRTVTGLAVGVVGALGLGAGLWMATNAPDKLREIWPAVEMRTGRDSESPEESGRRKLRFLAVEIAIPFALMILGLAIPPLLK
ncbi:hypothetical protein [Kribbella amoyensis]|uniref:hypothetical protein n=1 Tax=Kribbella amoyensis TaxID=996641 RepID=UPI0011A7C24D|nr:hypothetical protein [Kribbella amoyensis]